MANILTCYYRPKPGGLCKRLFRAINALLADGHTVHYLSVVQFPIDHPHCHFHRFPWNRTKTEGLFFWGVFHLLSPLILLLIGYRNKISNIFVFGHTYSFLMQPLHFLKGIPLSLFLRGDILESHKHNHQFQWLLLLDRRLEALAIAHVNLFCVSDSLIANIKSRHRLFKAKHMSVLRNDINKIPWECLLKNDYTFPLRLACVGILGKGKNQQFLLDVMENIRPEQAQLYLYGVGSEEIPLKEKVLEKQLSSYVHFMGWVDGELVWRDVDLLLAPSLHEGSPNAVLEAFSNNIPVLASEIPAHWEILPVDNLLSLDDPALWVDRLQKILQEPDIELKRMQEKQFPFAKRLYFDWDTEVCRMILNP